MTSFDTDEIGALVLPDKVHRRVYTDPDLFDLEMARIFGRVWVFVGHESQVPEPGDWIKSRIGTRHVLLTRDREGEIHVLRNQCAHRGMAVCAGERGNGKRLVCPYHGWAYHLDGSLAGVPRPRGYSNAIRPGDPDHGLGRAARVENYRGFVFASLADDGPTLADYLGDMASALDNMVDRAPAGRLEIAGGVHRQAFRGNWKLHMENACDLVHPSFVHQSSVDSARAFVADTGSFDEAGQAIQMFHSNGLDLDDWDRLSVYGYANGHCYMDGFYRGGMMDPEADTPVFDEYKAALVAARGEARTNEILGRDAFNNLIYPNLNFNTRFQQLRVIHPVAVDRTQLFSYSLRLVGAPDEMFRMSVRFVTTANSPASPISSDDLAIFEGIQAMLADGGVDWIDLSRRAGHEQPHGNAGSTDTGTSELSLRALLGAWRSYMTAA